MDILLSIFIYPLESFLALGFSLFRHNEVAISLSLLMVIVGLGCIVWFWFVRFVPYARALKDIRVEVERYDSPKDFEQLDNQLSRYPFFVASWASFKASLIFPTAKSDSVIHHTTRPHQYFYLRQDGTKGLNLSLQKALPNYFVGFGLLFTFIGLVAALYFANQGVASPDIAKAQEALKDLLHAATFKFMTSVAGLLMSLLIAITNRMALHRLQESYTALCEALEDRLPYLSEKAVAYMSYRETVMQRENFLDFRRSYGDEMAQVMEKAQQPLADTITHLAENLKDVNKEALAQMAEAFIETLNKAAAKELNGIANTLAQLNEDLDSLSRRLGMTGEDFENRLTTSATALRHSLDESAAGLGQTLRLGSEQFQNNVDSVTQRLSQDLLNGAQAIKMAGKESASILRTDLKGAGDGFAQSMSTSSQTFADQARLASENWREYMGQAASAMEQSVQHSVQSGLDASQRHAESLRKGVEETVNKLDQPLSVMTTRWEVLDQAFTHMDERLGVQLQAFEETVSGLEGALQQIHKAAQSFEGAATPMAEITQSMADHSQSLKATSEQERATYETIAQALVQLEGGVVAAQKGWEDYRLRFEETNNTYRDVFEQMSRELVQASSQQSESLKGIGAGFEGSVARLDERLNDFEERVSEMSSLMQSIAKAMKIAWG